MAWAQILERWPERTKPARSTLWIPGVGRGAGEAGAHGQGGGGNAFRYTLPAANLIGTWTWMRC